MGIHDYEGFGGIRISEYASFLTMATLEYPL
jgi:antirestriction protein